MTSKLNITRAKLIWSLKILVTILGLSYITFYFNHNISKDVLILGEISSLKIIIVILVLLFLSALNWFGEIKKWHVLVDEISFASSAKQTFIAQGFSIMTPQKVGEYGGKCLFYNKDKHNKIMALTGLGHLTQLAVTLILGIFGASVLITEYNVFQILSFQWSWGLLIIPAFLLVKPFRQRLKNVLKILKEVEREKILNAFFWSLFRYFIFAHQFFILLRLFEIQVDYITAMATINLVYFIASIIPVFGFADAIVKGSIALTVFGFIGFDDPSILTITFLMWISNFTLPAIIGYIWMLKWRPKILISKV